VFGSYTHFLDLFVAIILRAFLGLWRACRCWYAVSSPFRRELYDISI